MSQHTGESQTPQEMHIDQQPQVHPALKRLERLVGMWDVVDPSGAEATSGQIAYEWLQGGFYLLHHVQLKESQGIEVIGYDAASNSLKSHYFEGNTGQLLEYTYDLTGNTLTISFDKMDGQAVTGQFIGTFSTNDTFSGRWEWDENGVKNGYNVRYNRRK